MCKVWFLHDSSAEEKLNSLRKGCEKHVQRMNEAKNGKGVDRHLFGLKQLAIQKRQRIIDYELPSFFTDPSYSKLMTSVISTSNVTADSLDLFGFGPVTLNGLGIGYSLKKDRITINITAFENNKAHKFSNQLEKVLKEIKSLLDNHK
jgi:carnitine O-acetyltransferase